MIRYIAGIVFCCLLCTIGSTQTIETIHGSITLPPKIRTQEGTLDTAPQYLLAVCHQLFSEQERSQLDAQHISIVGFIPPSSYILFFPEGAEKMAAKPATIASFHEVPAALKMSLPVYRHFQQSPEMSATQYIVSTYRREELESLQRKLQQRGIVSRTEYWLGGTDCIVEIADRKTFMDVVEENIVAQISFYLGAPEIESSSNSMFGNQIFALNYDQLGPTGRNTYFSNIEYFGANAAFRLNTKGRNHPVFGTAFPDNTETLQHSHGSRVSLHAASSNAVDEYEDRGMAEGAVLIQMPAFDSIEPYYHQHGLHPLTLNVSAGIGGTSVEYNSTAREFDRITRSLEGFMLCFAAGNDGGSTNTSLGYGPGWANISGDHKTCKNNMTVHAAGRPGEHFDWACKGPTADGRLKPDISAEGQFGTSFASPNLAGLCNVLYESYTNTYQTSPRSDVVKAVILNTAIDADKPGIDFKSGFGTVNPTSAHRAIEEQRCITGSVAQGSTDVQTYTLSVPEGTHVCKVLLYWHDVEGTPGAPKALVNDLDLTLQTPEGDTFLPWVLDATPGHQYDLPLRKRDSLNNVEQITLTDPMPGEYTIVVKGHQVAIGPQPFVVTYETTPHGIEITSPIKGFRTGTSRNILFTWNAALDTSDQQNTISVSLMSDETGLMSLGTIPAHQKYFAYSIPREFPNTASARIIVAQTGTSIRDTSDRFHIMQTPGGLAFEKVCPDEISLRWSDLGISGTTYILYRLGEKYMDPISFVSDGSTSHTIAADTIIGVGEKFAREEWFAIAARHPNGALSLRSAPISVLQTNLVNTSTHIQKNYTLCYGDLEFVRALDLSRDSMRWFFNGQPIAGGTQLSLQIKGDQQGEYTYRTYQKDGCVFSGDTFFVQGPLQISDTTNYGAKVWEAYVLKDHLPSRYYGKVTLPALSLQSLMYYTEFEQIDAAPGYAGCAPDLHYTVLYKRKGFTAGQYQLDLRLIQHQMKLFIDGELLYTSPENMAQVGIIWSGHLDENSEVRIEHIVKGKALIHLEVVPLEVISPVGISDGLLLWLKGDQVRLDDNLHVRHWLDDAVTSLQNESDTAAKISVDASALNYRQVLNFSGQGGIFGKFRSSGSNNESVTFAVYQMEDTSDRNARVIGFGLPPYYIDNNYSGTFSPFYRNENTRQIGWYRNGNGVFPPGDRLNTWKMTTTHIQTNLTQMSDAGSVISTTPHGFQGLFYSTYSIGCRPDTSAEEGRMKGQVAEILHYNRSLTQSEIQKIQTYLGLKYGFTLSHDYFSADGREVYNRDGFSHQIAGVAREDHSGWNQNQSRSEEAPEDIIIGSAGRLKETADLNHQQLLTDQSYMIWGHNGAEAMWSVAINDTIMQMPRIWKLTQTGNTGAVRFYFSDAYLGEEDCIQYTALISDDALDFENAAVGILSVEQTDDLHSYHVLEIDFEKDTTVYVALQRIERTYTPGPLAEEMRAESNFCKQTLAYQLIDSLHEHVVSEVFVTQPDQLEHIDRLKVRTDHPASEAVNCGPHGVRTLINRTLSFSATDDWDQSGLVRLYLHANDSVRAAERLVSMGCPANQLQWRWCLAQDEDAFYTQWHQDLPLTYVSDEQWSFGQDGDLQYVTFTDLPGHQFFLAGVLEDTTQVVATTTLESIHIHAYPNPFEKSFSIEGIRAGDVVEVYDVLGRRLSRIITENTRLKIADIKRRVCWVVILRDGIICWKKMMVQIE